MASLEFYSLPLEQKLWLSKLVAADANWCVARLFPRERLEIDNATDIENLSFEREPAFDLCIGNYALEGPIWRKTPQGSEIDFVKSQALQFEPSIKVDDRVLLEGRIAICRPSEYELQDIDPGPVSSWYRKVRRSLTSIMSKDYVLTQLLTNGTTKEWKSVGVTQEAVAWRLKGGLLKQFAKGAVEFDVRRVSQKL